MIFDINFEALEQELTAAKRKAVTLSILRLFLFFFILAILVVGLSEWKLLLISVPFLVSIFVYLIIQFNFQKDKEAFIKQLIQIEKDHNLRNRRELSAFDSGENFQEKNHAFASDLDLFGQHSLYQLMNHTVNESGKMTLARWLKGSFDTSLAMNRRRAIQELSQRAIFLKSFEGIGKAFVGKEKSKRVFYDWLKKSQSLVRWISVPMVLGPVGGVMILAGTLFFGLPYGWIGIWILWGMIFLSFVFKSLMEAASVLPNQGDIKTYRIWSELLGKEKFESDYLQALHAPFHRKENSAREVFDALEQMTFLIQNRGNLVYVILNLLFWTDLYLYWKLLTWKSKHAMLLAQWEHEFDEWQAITSLAAFEQEENQSCEVNWGKERSIHVRNIKHPLLPKEKAIGNDFTIDENTKTILLTGANMSGKTTFMRTLGINMILANLGLTPFADHFEMGPFQLFTSMRNSDNLGESVSSFYAELARIKRVLEVADSGQNVFFLLDEILKGTNTEDRIKGSEALIRQLASTNSKGIISTHDVELSTLESSLNYLKNKSFHSEISDNEIFFDYKIKNGPCLSFNAHKLMELMGIRFQ
ncbi:DNA mismatch repair protein [Belliella kenyensis]|uniref:DNA mismatch repair protein n=1 Tax=Belliella kenyensis TaxID=1472724 RepID=A0ABV8EMG6_9BACT|nr:DNA mismatch repair protein [Belliella kenyensis]MCH7401568.1 DNA mismatch repair protein [Belliella kenyensis]MDN3603152.1 DNA mismatch repair protein [Belliella kenyensis]